MAVPDYQTLMLPVLRHAGRAPADGTPLKLLVDAMAREFALSPEEQREMLPSGASTTLRNRIGWACAYLKQAGLLSAPKRG